MRIMEGRDWVDVQARRRGGEGAPRGGGKEAQVLPPELEGPVVLD